MSRWWWAGALAAAALIALGGWLGEPGQALRNASDVCLACMGIG